MSAGPESVSNEAAVDVGGGPLAAPILGRVVGMLAARADCPIDRLDDALLVCDAVAAKAATFSDAGRMRVHVSARIGAVQLRVGPLREGGADGLVASAALPGIGNVLEQVADELEFERRDGGGGGGGGGGGDYLLIRLGFDHQRPSTIGRMESDVS